MIEFLHIERNQFNEYLPKNMKFRLVIASTLMIMAMTSSINAQIDANQAISELSILQESLNQSEINERTIKQTREKAIEIRTNALICVDQIEPQV